MREIVLNQVQCMYQGRDCKPVLDSVEIKCIVVPVCAVKVYGDGCISSLIFTLDFRWDWSVTLGTLSPRKGPVEISPCVPERCIKWNMAFLGNWGIAGYQKQVNFKVLVLCFFYHLSGSQHNSSGRLLVTSKQKIINFILKYTAKLFNVIVPAAVRKTSGSGGK